MELRCGARIGCSTSSSGKAVDELQPAHCLLSLGTYCPISLGGHVSPSVLSALTMPRTPNGKGAARATRNPIAGRAALLLSGTAVCQNSPSLGATAKGVEMKCAMCSRTRAVIVQDDNIDRWREVSQLGRYRSLLPVPNGRSIVANG